MRRHKLVLLVLLALGCGVITLTPTPAGPDTFLTDTPAVPTLDATAPPTATDWFITPTPEAFVARARVIAEPCLRLRAVPEIGATIDCLPTGTVVDVLRMDSTWWLVEVPMGSQGWAHSGWLEVIQ